MRVYLAGKMRSVPLSNFPAFDAAEAALTEAGYEVFSPAQRDRLHGFNGATELSGDDLRKAFQDDTGWICGFADAIVVLDGWEESRGATAEVALGRALDLKIMTLSEALEAATCKT